MTMAVYGCSGSGGIWYLCMDCGVVDRSSMMVWYCWCCNGLVIMVLHGWNSSASHYKESASNVY